MTLVSLLQGQESTKVIDGKESRVIPFAGTDEEGKLSQMGVGLIFPENGRGYIWGLACPHKLVASYRGMKIAELVHTFEHSTLCACWYAGERNIHPSEQRYVNEIEGKIGVHARKGILNAPLPNLDEVILKMDELGIGFEADELLVEIKAGRLKPSQVVDKAIEKYFDKCLVFRGLSGDLRKAYEKQTAKGLKANLRRLFHNYDALEGDYIAAAEQMFRNELPAMGQGLEQIRNVFAGIHEDFDKLSDREILDMLSPRETFTLGTKRIGDSIEKAVQAITGLQETGESYKPHERFVLYHDNLRKIGSALLDLKLEASSLATSECFKDEGIKRNGEAYKAIDKQANDLLRHLNRALREQMPGMYSLIR